MSKLLLYVSLLIGPWLFMFISMNFLGGVFIPENGNSTLMVWVQLITSSMVLFLTLRELLKDTVSRSGKVISALFFVVSIYFCSRCILFFIKLYL